MPEKTVTLKVKRENAVHDILYPPHSSLVSSSDKGKYYCNEIKKIFTGTYSMPCLDKRAKRKEIILPTFCQQ